MVSFASRFSKTLAGDSILVPHLNTWFANAEFDDEITFSIHPNKEEDDAFHPSSALKCAQELYAAMRDELPKEMHSADLQKTFMFGHFAHAIIQKIVVELGFTDIDDIEREYDFHFKTEAGNSFRVRGFTDIARCEVPNRGTYLVDIKTMNARVYSSDTIPEATQEKWEAQVKLYLEFEDLPEAIVLVVEKDSPHRFKEVMVQRDPEFVDLIVEKWEAVTDALALGEPPECTCAIPAKCIARGLYDSDSS